MALLWMDGFEKQLDSGIYYASYFNNGYLNSLTAFNYGYARGSSTQWDDGNYFTKQLDNLANILCNFHVFVEKKTTGTFYYYVSFYDSTTVQTQVRFYPDSVKVYRGDGTTLLGETSYDSPMDEYKWIGVSATINNSTGAVQVQINGSTVINLTGQNTRSSSNNYSNAVRFGLYKTNVGQFTNFRIDNLFIMDNSGSKFNSLLTERRIMTAFPTADGNYTDFTASSGNRYACVDEAPTNGDTDYVYASSSGNRVSFTHSDVLGNYSSVDAVQITSFLRKDDAASYTVRKFMRIGGTNYDVGSNITATAGYSHDFAILENDPSTNSDWTATNAQAEFGLRIA